MCVRAGYVVSLMLYGDLYLGEDCGTWRNKRVKPTTGHCFSRSPALARFVSGVISSEMEGLEAPRIYDVEPITNLLSRARAPVGPSCLFISLSCLFILLRRSRGTCGGSNSPDSFFFLFLSLLFPPFSVVFFFLFSFSYPRRDIANNRSERT